MMLSVNRFSVPGLAVLVAALALLAPARPTMAQSSILSEVEPNNTRNTANELPVENLTFSGASNRQGDVDYFRTTLTEGNVLRVFLQGLTQNFDGRVQILNADGEILAEDRRQGASSTLTLSATITAATPPGFGFIRISNDINDGVVSNFNYTVTLTQGVPEVEPNNDPASAQVLSQTFPIVGTYPARTNVTDDFFTFTTTGADETVILTLDYAFNINVTLRLELQDVDGEVVAFSDRTPISGSGAPKNPSLAVLLPDPGTYFVRLYNPASVPQLDSIVNYALFFGLRTGAFEQEPNQSFTESVPVPLEAGATEAVIGGTLQSGQDVDVYRIIVPAGTQLVADVDVISPFPVMDGVVSVFLQEDLGLPFASNDDSSVVPDGASFALVNEDPYIRVVPGRAGEMYVAVADRRNRGGAAGFEYRLHVQTISQPPSESEPNDQPGSERRLETGETVRGTIGSTGDVDRFVIEGSQGQTLLVNLNAFGIGSFLDARVVLRDPAGVLLADRSDSAFSLDPFVLVPELALDGDYIIEVSQRLGQSGSGVSYYYELSPTLNISLDALVADPDVDGSGRVDGFDLVTMARSFGLSQGEAGFAPGADLVVDGVIDGLDLAILGNFFGTEVSFGGLAGIVVDTVGDDTSFFGPSAGDTVDLIGIGTSVSGNLVNINILFRDSVDDGTGGLLSIDSEGSGLTGSRGTPDVYVEEQNLGSDLEIFFSSGGFNVFSVPDPRGDIYPAFEALVGGGTCTSPALAGKSCASDQDCLISGFPTPCQLNSANFPNNPLLRRQPTPQIISTGQTQVAGNRLNFSIDEALLGGSLDANAAALGVAVEEVDPTDRLPNRGKVALRPPFQVASIVATQLVCDDGRRTLCLSDQDCVDAGLTGPCVDVDSLPPDSAGGAPLVQTAIGTREMVYLRTQEGGPRFSDFERSVPPTLGTLVDGGTSQHNDTLARVFPFGTRGQAGNDSRFEWFHRDMLSNFGVRRAFFDPHLGGTGALPPPDQDLYYLQGGEGDRVILEVKTDDDGQAFNSALEIYLLPLGTVALDPTSSQSALSVAASDLVFVARNDDRDGSDLDPRLEATLPATGLYLVRVAASVCPSQTVDPAACNSAATGVSFPGTNVFYDLEHETLAPGEISIPVIARGAFRGTGSPVAGLQVTLEFDPDIVRMTGFDLAQGMRNTTVNSSLNPSTAQEIVAERTGPGRVQLAVRSYRDNTFTAVNALTGDGFGGSCGSNSGNCPEVPIARLRFRGVGGGSTVIRFAENPTAEGEPLLNLGIGNRETGPVWQPRFGYGPGVQVTVTGTDQ